jgi:crotonobetainyl-CoA:carnitine CoA-transferase CaiB-like acyl-CoA transferase
MVVKLENYQDSGIDLALPGLAIKFSNHSAQSKFEFSQTGQHNREILQKLGYTPQEIEFFIEKKAIGIRK